MNKFNCFETETKHGLKLRVYQYIGEGHVGLNFLRPAEFEPKRTPDTKFSKLAAYYFAHAIRQRRFIVKEQGHGQNNYSLTVMLWFLAKDSEGASDSTEIAPYEPSIFGEGKLTLKEIFSHYESIDFEIIYIAADFGPIRTVKLPKVDSCRRHRSDASVHNCGRSRQAKERMAKYLGGTRFRYDRQLAGC